MFVEEMKRAINNKELTIYIQPKFSIKKASIYGGEALVRWIHPTKGILEPKDFLPQCIENNLMNELDYYVWEYCCQVIKRWNEELHHCHPISMKISRDSLYSNDIIDRLNNLVEKYQIDKKYLQLEIEEDSFRDDIYQAKEAINQLHYSGFTILLDDFSYGCSSISALNQIDVDILKVDMKFFSSVPDAGKGEIILASIIKSANWIGMSVLAECVETKQQRDFALASGCDYSQGFYYSPALPLDKFEEKYIIGELNLVSEVENKTTHNMTVMVIDDMELERELLYRYLRDDYHVVLCETSEEALVYLSKYPGTVFLILIDYVMPGMNGIQFLQYCQSDEDLMSIPKMMITSNEQIQSQVQAFESGVQDYILKPLIPELVKIRVRNIIGLNNKIQTSQHDKLVYKHQAELDEFTGLLNKTSFRNYVEKHIHNNPLEKQALLVVDIDNFKQINDTLGHLIGDSVIKMIAEQFSANFRTTDFVGRFGGDEFIVCVVGKPTLNLINDKLTVIMNNIKKISKEQFNTLITISVGIAINDNNDNFDELFKKADQALYSVKKHGKGQIAFYK